MFFLLVLVFVNSCSSLDQYQKERWLDDAKSVYLRWGIPTDDNGETSTILFEISAPTKGYIGFGLSPNGGMRNSDIAVAWVDKDGESHIEDRFALGNFEPVLDVSQDWVVSNTSYENSTHTVVRFSRLLVTCDEQDRAIDNGATRIIFSLGIEDPHNGIRKHQRSGVKTVYLMDDLNNENDKNRKFDKRDVTHVHEFKLDNYTIGSEKTTYFCKVYNMPNITEEMDVIGFEPIRDHNSKLTMHHTILYICDSDTVAPPSDGFQCYSSSTGYTPNVYQEKCKTVQFAWAIGGENEYYPNNVGFRLRPNSPLKYMLVEYHFDNPKELSGAVSSAGTRLLMSNRLREKDAGLVFITNGVGLEFVVPGETKEFSVITSCPKECTNSFLPQEGVTVFKVMLHSHIKGRSMVLRHFRNGVELPPIVEDTSYDFKYQTFRNPDTLVLPGDDLVLDCNYTSIGFPNSTVGGWATSDEMCMALAYVYPKPQLETCGSSAFIGDVADILGVKYNHQKLNQDVDLLDASKFGDQLVSLKRKYKAINWKGKYQDKLRLQNFYKSGNATWVCQATDLFTSKKQIKTGNGIDLTWYKPYSKPQQC